jgi:uncharacterized membrane protein
MEWWFIGACLFAVIVSAVIVVACWRQARESDRDYFGD